MGHRLSKIYTRTGDAGSTGLGDGNRVDKDHPRVEAFGTVDELNSQIGLLLTEIDPASEVAGDLTAIQHDLFDLGGELSIPGHRSMEAKQVEHLEARLDALNADLPYLKEFILPGGCRAAALAHVARTVCRRAERRLFSLSRDETLNPSALQYLNRLSDYLFVLARHLNRAAGRDDVLWDRSR